MYTKTEQSLTAVKETGHTITTAGVITLETDHSTEMDIMTTANTTDQTIETQAPTLTSPIGCSTGHASRMNHRVQTATSMKLMDTTTTWGKRDQQGRKK